MKIYLTMLLALTAISCAHNKMPNDEDVSPDEAAKFNRKLVRESVVFEPGSKDGAVIPDVAAPRLRAVMVPERVENNRLIEAHREWLLEGEVSLIGIPPQEKPQEKGDKRK